MFRGFKNQPIISYRLKALKIRRRIYFIFVLTIGIGLVVSLLTSHLNSSLAKASVQIEGGVVINGISHFESGDDPTFHVKTEGLAIFGKNKTAQGELTDGNQKIKASLKFDSTQIEQKPEITVLDTEGQFEIKALKNSSFKPGKYQLNVDLINDNQVVQSITEDFTWGVLAINANKSIYSPGETAYLQMAVLNDLGRTICNQSLKLEIQAPNSKTQTLATSDGSITKSDNCGPNNVTDLPDYFANYQLQETGEYQLKLTNLDNGYTIQSSIESKEQTPFDIERIGATRINPFKASYVMSLKVKANQDLNGSIREKVPASFEINEISGSGQVSDKNANDQTISWPQNVKSGDSIELSYRYQAPKISPEFYLLGPLEIYQTTVDSENGGATGETKIFDESHQWQIASDTTNTCVAILAGAWRATPSTTYWSGCGSTYPNTSDIVQIANFAMTIPTGESDAAASVTFMTATGGSIAITSTGSLALSGALTVNSLAGGAMTGTISGTGTLTCGSIQIGSILTPSATVVTKLISTITSLQNSGGTTLTGDVKTGGTAYYNNPTIEIQAGKLETTGITTNMPNATNAAIITNTTGAHTGYLKLTSTTPWTDSAKGTITVNLNGVGGTVEYSAAGAVPLRVTAYGNLTLSGSSGTYTGAVASVSGALAMSGGVVWTADAITTTMTSITLTGTAALTVGANTTTSGALSIGDGTNFTIGALTLNVGTTTTVGAGTSGSLDITSATSTKTFTGAVTINAGADITESAAAALTFSNDVTITGTLTESGAAVVGIAGSLTNNGTYTASTGIHTFSGASKVINGTATGTSSVTSIPSVTVSGTVANSNALTVATSFIVTGTLTNNGTIIATTLLTLNTAGAVTNNGTVTASTALSGTSSGAFTNAAAGILNIAGTSGITNLTATASGNTVNYTGAAQTLHNNVYHHLNLSGSLAKTMTGIGTVAGNMTMAGSCTATTAAAFAISGSLDLSGTAMLTTGAYTFSVGTTTHIANGADLIFSSATNPGKTFTGDVTIDSGGIWNEQAAVTPSFAGNFTNDGTFTSSSGAHTFSGATKIISGTAAGTSSVTSIPSVAITGTITNSNALTVATLLTLNTAGALANNGTITVTTALSGTSSGAFTNAATGILNIGGTSGITNLTATASGNIVNYTGSGQTVHSNNYDNLVFNGIGGTIVLQAGTTAITGYLTIACTNTCATTLVHDLAITGALSVGTTTNTATLTTGAYALSVNGLTDINNRGTLTINNATGTKTFAGVTVDIGGTWNCSTAVNIGISGDLSNSGTFTPSTGTYTLSGASKAMSGTFSNAFTAVTLSGGSQTSSATLTIATLTVNNTFSNSGTIDVNTTLAGSNILTNGAGGTLTIGAATASMTLTGLTASAATNTVNYDGTAGQTVKDTTDHHYSNLTINCSGQTATLAAAVIVDNDLTITSGTLNTSGTSYGITVTGNWANSGTFTSNASTVTFNKGNSTQTLNSGGIGAGKMFNNLLHSGAGTLQLLTNNLNIDGNFTNSAGTFDTNSLDITIAGNTDLTTGSLTQGTRTITLDGSGAQTFTAGDTGAGHTPYNLTVANTAGPTNGVTFADSLTLASGGTFTDTTANSKLTFADNGTYSLPLININGSVSGNVTMTWTSGAHGHWHFIVPGTPTVTYVMVDHSDATGSGAQIDATSHCTNNNNNTYWNFSSNTAPNSPTSLVQKKVTGGATLATGDFTNETQVQFTATASDTDNPDTLYLCVEKDTLTTAFSSTNGGDLCGSGVAYSGTPVTVTVTITGLTDTAEYHWQAQVKDTAVAYSSFVTYGGNTENPPTNPAARDFGIDTTAPTGGTVSDGTGVDIGYNNGSLSSLSANWTGVVSTAAGLNKYEYGIGTTAGGTDTKTWTNNNTSTSVTDSSLTLRTGQTYYFSIRTTDNATNVSTPINSNGQAVAPTLTFSYASGSSIVFDELNSGNSWTDSAKTTVLQTSTNAYSGYVIKARTIDKLRHSGNISSYIDYYSGTNSTPTTWSGTGFGYTTSDNSLSGGTADRFTNGGPKYAGFTETGPGDPVADHTANVTGTPLTNEQFTITYRVTGNSTTPAGKYSTTIIYTCIPQY